MAFVTRFWRVIIAPITARDLQRVTTHIMASFLRDIIAPIIEWHLWRVTRAITQVILAYRYCGFGDADFAARYIAYGGVLFGVRHMRFETGAFFCALFAL